MLKKREREVFIHLLENARMPDKLIAKLIGTTQPTVTRTRQKLEKAGYIKGYKPIVDFRKVGIGLVVMTFFRIADFSKIKEIKNKVLPDLKKMPEIFLVAEGEGMGKTSLIVSMHKDFPHFEDWMVDLRKRHGQYAEDIDHFIFPTDKIFKEFTTESVVIDILKKGET